MLSVVKKTVLAHSFMTAMYQNEFKQILIMWILFTRTKKSIITFSYNLNRYVKALSSLEKIEKVVYTPFHFQPEQNC
ncbi:hypothetical protein C5467_01575 [Photorhabdus khanii subsp. guanajuatensis]|uniref:Uncharacterized protein n=1 Tax=Photorhabdus khanii subsp. guanajuatensis TaxID=2100166 RepID=A0A4R4KA50_9GAMM|nr:hypothetical protein C5467_01575 [Photorhabdus khanii subsp. guanajuatensis]